MTERFDIMARRTFLKLLGAGAGLAGLSACTGRLPDFIVPYVEQPELAPGPTARFATSAVLDGYATGVIVDAHEGRPTKVEGNPEHPSSLGAAGVHEQALLLQLYDPCRARNVRRGPDPVSFARFARACEDWKEVHFLLEPTGSPLLKALLSRFPGENVHFHAPLSGTGPLEAARRLLGRALVARPSLEGARRVLALDSDFLASGPNHLRFAHDFAAGREPTSDMSRLYAVEPAPTPTGMLADHRFARRSSEVERFARAVLGEVLRLSGSLRSVPEELLRAAAEDRKAASACARDFWAHRGRAVVLAGERQTAGVHACALALSELLGTARLGEPVLLFGTPLPESMETLVVIGGNPVYDMPGFEFSRARTRVYAGLYENETATEAQWFVPLAHVFESWGDARSWDGTVSAIQPLVRPLHGGKRIDEVLACFGEPIDPASRCSKEVLERGFVPGSALPAVRASVDWKALPALLSPAMPGAIEVTFARDPAVHDGRFANNPWLLELPDPVTKLTWDKAALLSRRTADALGVATEDVVKVTRGGASIEIPVFVVPGHADGALTVPLGYGRRGAEAIARGVGRDAYPLARGALFASDVTVERVLNRSVAGAPPFETPARERLATTQRHSSIEGRAIVEERTLAEHAKAKKRPLPVFSSNEIPQWGMTIDLSKCSGCNACVLACQAENNVPVVGKDGVLDGREMHWLRVDRYLAGDRFLLEPMLCQHCEKAPCEYVCPVNATTHSPDGLNEQTYNRCIGTRFCSNNCPYKVRKFNWFNYSKSRTDGERLATNPDVTVRERGVMEKCTFCVQRIRGAEIQARNEGRPIREGDFQTACQQACPSRAIVFGNLADPGSEVARRWQDWRHYAVLEELGTLPRVRYLARVRNPNPELAA